MLYKTVYFSGVYAILAFLRQPDATLEFSFTIAHPFDFIIENYRTAIHCSRPDYICLLSCTFPLLLTRLGSRTNCVNITICSLFCRFLRFYCVLLSILPISSFLLCIIRKSRLLLTLKYLQYLHKTALNTRKFHISAIAVHCNISGYDIDLIIVTLSHNSNKSSRFNRLEEIETIDAKNKEADNLLNNLDAVFVNPFVRFYYEN